MPRIWMLSRRVTALAVMGTGVTALGFMIDGRLLVSVLFYAKTAVRLLTY